MGDVESGSRTSTSHITAADRQGGIAALTTTLLSAFGSRYVLPSTGILMNNGVMWFDPRPGRPNSIAPGKRALTNMCPIVVARDGRPWFGAGASGGRRILGAVLQLASFVVDFGMDPEAAAHHPRIDVNGRDRFGVDRRRRCADHRAAVATAGGDSRGAHRISHPLCVPQPRLARCRRDQSRHFRCDVAVVGSGCRANR